MMFGQLQVLQDMGLPTGVELKTAEPVKSEEAVVATTVEELRPVVTPIETTAAATGTPNADSTDAAEVQSFFQCVSKPQLQYMHEAAECFNLTNRLPFPLRLLANRDQSSLNTARTL